MCSKHYAEYNAFFQLAYIKKISKCASYLLHQDRVFFFLILFGINHIRGYLLSKQNFECTVQSC